MDTQNYHILKELQLPFPNHRVFCLGISAKFRNGGHHLGIHAWNLRDVDILLEEIQWTTMF